MTLLFSGIADAYLEWAVHTKFVGFADALSDTTALEVGLVAKRVPNQSLPKEVGWTSAALYDKQAYLAGAIPASWLMEPNNANTLREYFSAVELASPVAEPTRPAYTPPFQTEGLSPKWLAPTASVVLGCIDDAFPIASQNYFSSQESRVLRLWDQGRNWAESPTLGWCPLGIPEVSPKGLNFAYGAELISKSSFFPDLANMTMQKKSFWRGLLTFLFFRASKKPTGGSSSTPTPRPGTGLPTSADAKADMVYYQRMGLLRLRHRFTHGSGVLEALAGPLSVESRLERPMSRSQQTTDEIAQKAPLVLVQLPTTAIADPSGRWLARHVLDGLHYILAAAGEKKTVVINVSWGPQTGPHDGSSLLEQAMNDLAVEYQKDGVGKLHIVLPAGNSYQLRAHAQFETTKGCKDLIWVVPPDRRTASFLEVWWPDVKAAADITVTAPDGSSIQVKKPGINSNGHGVVRWGITLVKRSERIMALIAVQPKSRLHGQWKISVKKIDGAAGDVHIYVARSAPNMGASHHDRPSYLLDPNYEDAVRQRNGLTIADSKSPMKESLVKRQGTLSGIATGGGVHVAGASRHSDGEPAPYTSSGLGIGAGRKCPDFAPPGDESKGLPGVLVGAVRAGSVVRLQGTSIAAPQLARRLVNAAGKSPDIVQLPPPDPRIGNGWPPHLL